MIRCDVVDRLFQGVCKKGAVHHGLFLLGGSWVLGYFLKRLIQVEVVASILAASAFFACRKKLLPQTKRMAGFEAMEVGC